ncbi:FtsW/RodA/SpoVE family cell cycle protein [Pseudonocardiaceae bacterium YIM PH 21723]|nr:FtsW/RodA/SpoVE family cell cycle protein [Pseudonocardiaceae bacterium YIM PH 21723]
MSQPVSGAPGTQTPAPAPSVPTRRGTELLLLAFAAVLVTGALGLVSANQNLSLDNNLFYYGFAFMALFGGVHLVVRRWAPYADPLILPCAALINGLGLVMIYRLDLASDSHFIPKQIGGTAIGLVLFAAVLILLKDHRMLARYGYTCGLVGLVALAIPGVLPSSLSAAGGAKIWILLGPFSIQPGEFAKILLMIFFASFLVSKRDLFMAAGRRVGGLDLPRARDLGPVIAAWLVSIAVLVLEKDLGTSLLFYGILLTMLYISTERIGWVIVGGGMFVGGALIAWKVFYHVQVRVDGWLNPLADPNDKTYQISQSLFGFATGGIAGSGLGAGRPDLVPEARSDFILTSIGEELGFIGLAALLMIYILLITRGMRSALAVRDSFGKLLAAGLSFAIGFQVFIVAGGVTTLIPLTGLTTPFLAYGGSSLLANWILIGLLLRISDAARRPSGGTRPRIQHATPIAEASTELVTRPEPTT